MKEPSPGVTTEEGSGAHPDTGGAGAKLADAANTHELTLILTCGAFLVKLCASPGARFLKTFQDWKIGAAVWPSIQAEPGGGWQGRAGRPGSFA